MTPERWQKIEQLYHSTLECEENQRAAFLCEVCAGDAALQREVESLLAQGNWVEQFLEKPAMDVAARMLAENQSHSSLVGRQLGSYKIVSFLGAGGWGKFIKRTTPSLGARWRSKFSRRPSSAIRNGWRDFSAKREYLPH
jgi:hypothetical protein